MNLAKKTFMLGKSIKKKKYNRLISLCDLSYVIYSDLVIRFSFLISKLFLDLKIPFSKKYSMYHSTNIIKLNASII